MMTKEEYKENVIRMWDSVRTDNKGAENCGGVRCFDCPLYGKACGSLYAFEALEIIENWATKEEYKENVIRMWDSVRTDNKGAENCGGVRCFDCPLYGKACGSLYAFEALEIIENWAKEHPIKTNDDKYKEVFGFEPFTNNCINGEIECEDCECYNGVVCDANKRFWNAEYKGKTEGCEEE